MKVMKVFLHGCASVPVGCQKAEAVRLLRLQGDTTVDIAEMALARQLLPKHDRDAILEGDALIYYFSYLVARHKELSTLPSDLKFPLLELQSSPELVRFANSPFMKSILGAYPSAIVAGGYVRALQLGQEPARDSDIDVFVHERDLGGPSPSLGPYLESRISEQEPIFPTGYRKVQIVNATELYNRRTTLAAARLHPQDDVSKLLSRFDLVNACVAVTYEGAYCANAWPVLERWSVLAPDPLKEERHTLWPRLMKYRERLLDPSSGLMYVGSGRRRHAMEMRGVIRTEKCDPQGYKYSWPRIGTIDNLAQQMSSLPADQLGKPGEDVPAGNNYAAMRTLWVREDALG